MTAALAAVLTGIAVFTFWGTLQTTHVTTKQSHALVLDAMFSEARSAVAVEEMHTRQYQLEPSLASRARYELHADAADEVLRRAARDRHRQGPRGRAAAERGAGRVPRRRRTS